jgi:hypothetical protein
MNSASESFMLNGDLLVPHVVDPGWASGPREVSVIG